MVVFYIFESQYIQSTRLAAAFMPTLLSELAGIQTLFLFFLPLFSYFVAKLPEFRMLWFLSGLSPTLPILASLVSSMPGTSMA